MVAKLAVLALALAVARRTLPALRQTHRPAAATRHTLERWSNGDENPVTIALKSDYGTAMHLRVLDELPVQFQKRDLVFTGPACRPWSRHLRLQRAPGEAWRVQLRRHPGLRVQRVRVDGTALQLRCRRKEVAVYPSYLQLRKYELLAISDRLTLAGIKRVRRVAQHAEFERIKDYVSGDDRRTVNWKATARRGR